MKIHDSSKQSQARAWTPAPAGQFGYIFTQGFSDEEHIAIAVAHELGHGQFLLKHPFDNSYRLLQNGLPENLMDYGNGTHLAKWQWDIIKSPGVVNRVFEREGDAMVIKLASAMNKVYKENFYSTVNLLLRQNTGGIFNQVYTDVKQSSQNFTINTYTLDDMQYVDATTNGYFRANENPPHDIRFAPNTNTSKVYIETTTKSPTTVFEELFHAAQFLYYSNKQASILIETEVKIAKGYILYINGGYYGTDFKEWTSKDDGGKSVLVWDYGKNDYKYKGIINYFKAVQNKDNITDKIRENYKKDVMDYAKTVIVTNYKKKNWVESEINAFDGKTSYLKHLIEK